jgi:hypothetical protein
MENLLPATTIIMADSTSEALAAILLREFITQGLRR